VTAQRYISREATNSTKRVVDALANALPASWHIFTEVPVLESKPGFTLVTDADLLLADPTKGFCFIELKGGRIRRQGSQWQQQDGKTSLWKDIKPMFQATRCQREFVSWLKTAKIKAALKGHYPMRGSAEQIPAIARVLFLDSKRPTAEIEQAASAYYWAGEIRELINDIDKNLPLQKRELVDIKLFVNALVGDREPDSSPLTPEAEIKIDRTAELFVAIDKLKAQLGSVSPEQQATFQRLITQVTESALSDVSADIIQQLRSEITKISETLKNVQLSGDKLGRLTSDLAEIKKTLQNENNAKSDELAALLDTLKAVQLSLDSLKKERGSVPTSDEVGHRVDQLAKLFRAQKRRYLAATFFLTAALAVFFWATLQASPEIDRAVSRPTVSAGIASEDNVSGLAATDGAVGGAGGSGPGNGGGESVGPDSSDPDGSTPLDANLSDSDMILSTTLPTSTTLQSSTTTSTLAQPTTTSTTTTSTTTTTNPTTTTTTTIPATTVPPITYKPLVASQVSAGRWFSCALDQLGKPYCWGSNFVASLGDGTSESRAFALPTIGDRNLTTLVSHGLHTCGLDGSGIAYCWGNGQPLGSVSSGSGSVPTRVEAPQPFASIHVAASSTCGITSGGSAFCWGTDAAPIDFRSWRRSQTPIEFDPSVAISSISAGHVRGCYIETSGSASCWPANTNDERPAVLPFAHKFVPDSLTGVALGYPIGGHSCARDITRGWMCWGSNTQGQLGAIDGLQCGFSTSFCSGFFRNTLTSEFSTIMAGDGFTCGLKPDGQILCWGLNSLGQLGRGTTTQNASAEQLRQNATPTPISSSLLFDSLAVGSSHACGITRDTKSVWCWGDNTYGQLGNRSRTNSPVPVEVVRRG